MKIEALQALIEPDGSQEHQEIPPSIAYIKLRPRFHEMSPSSEHVATRTTGDVSSRLDPALSHPTPPQRIESEDAQGTVETILEERETTRSESRSPLPQREKSLRVKKLNSFPVGQARIGDQSKMLDSRMVSPRIKKCHCGDSIPQMQRSPTNVEDSVQTVGKKVLEDNDTWCLAEKKNSELERMQSELAKAHRIANSHEMACACGFQEEEGTMVKPCDCQTYGNMMC